MVMFLNTYYIFLNHFKRVHRHRPLRVHSIPFHSIPFHCRPPRPPPPPSLRPTRPTASFFCLNPYTFDISYISRILGISSSEYCFFSVKKNVNRSFWSIDNWTHKFCINNWLLYSVLYFVRTFVNRTSVGWNRAFFGNDL